MRLFIQFWPQVKIIFFYKTLRCFLLAAGTFLHPVILSVFVWVCAYVSDDEDDDDDVRCECFSFPFGG